MTADLDPRSKARLTRALWLARAVMLWEQGAAVWTPFLLAAGAVATAGLWGLFEPLEFTGHAALVGVAFVVALGFAVRGAMAVRWPTREETRARLEADSRLIHAPIASLEDTPLAGDATLWALHRARAAQAIRETRVGRPKAGVAAADPFALRYALVVAAVLALWARGPERAREAPAAFTPVGAFASATGHAGEAAAVKISEGAHGLWARVAGGPTARPATAQASAERTAPARAG
jgi:hypothetical protein